MSTSGDGRRGAAARAARLYKETRLAVKGRLGLFDDVIVETYRSEGTGELLRVRGRVMERRGTERVRREEESVLRNIRNTVRRLESDEIPGAAVVARFGGIEVEATADNEGFFELELRGRDRLASGWHAVEVELLDSMAGGQGEKGTAEVLVPEADAEYVIVSDLDDTVIRSHATETIGQIRTLFGHSATTRNPMPGAAPLYEALSAGPDRAGRNPFFYVSMSGWGLYDLFVEFLDAEGFPKGGVFLQDLALVEERSKTLGSEDHKRDTILRLMETYPTLPFVLVGDSGQHDPELYRDLARERPDRVRAILVRDVTEPERDREVRRIEEEVEELGIPMAAAESSISLARAAADFDLISHETIRDVRRRMVERGEV